MQEVSIGSLVKFYSSDAPIWQGNDEDGPDLTILEYASDISTEEENPLAMILGTDFTGLYCRVLWSGRTYWVMTSTLSTVLEAFPIK